MENLQIDSGEKRIAINGDESRVIVFNPSNALFAEKFYNFVAEIKAAFPDYEARAKAIDANKALDDDGLPLNFLSRMEVMKEMHAFVSTGIDQIFGAGTSMKVFGDIVPTGTEMYEQFFNGITPYIQKARAAKIEKYTNVRPKRVKK